MKLRKLNSVRSRLAACMLTLLVVCACNNSKKEENTSTTTTDTSLNKDGMDNNGTNKNVANTGSDTSVPTKTVTNQTTGKKIGKVYARTIQADSRAKVEMDKAGISSYPEVMPKYPGGQMALENFISNNIEYPQEAIDNNVEGTVFVLFTVDEDGNVSNAKLTGNKLGYGLDEAALKVISQMPKWTPGTTNGKAVKAWFTFPITFRLED